ASPFSSTCLVPISLSPIKVFTFLFMTGPLILIPRPLPLLTGTLILVTGTLFIDPGPLLLPLLVLTRGRRLLFYFYHSRLSCLFLFAPTCRI
uniref:Uncharacterized protein n=1 Tax=Amphimedon queenslandica TaxID=400682 RepID=A0A1X7VCP7_AMPQE